MMFRLWRSVAKFHLGDRGVYLTRKLGNPWPALSIQPSCTPFNVVCFGLDFRMGLEAQLAHSLVPNPRRMLHVA